MGLRHTSDGDILGFPSTPDAQNSKVIWSTQIRNDRKENKQSTYIWSVAMKLSFCPCHETGRNHSAPRAKLLATQRLCASWRTSAELPPAQLSTALPAAELFAAELLTAQLLPSKGLSGVGMCGVGNALKHGSLSNSPKERRSPCRRESRSCSRLGCQVFLLTALKKLVVLTITRPNVNLSNRSNSQVQGLVTRELSVGPEGLGGRCGPFEDAVGFQIGYWVHVEYG